jgi:hypothetical protein
LVYSLPEKLKPLAGLKRGRVQYSQLKREKRRVLGEVERARIKDAPVRRSRSNI